MHSVHDPGSRSPGRHPGIGVPGQTLSRILQPARDTRDEPGPVGADTNGVTSCTPSQRGKVEAVEVGQKGLQAFGDPVDPAGHLRLDVQRHHGIMQ